MLFALFLSMGGHWFVFQSVAWIGMIHDSWHQSGKWNVALSQTFDGKHACALCLKIQKQRSSEEKQQQFNLPDLKKDFLATTSVPIPAPMVTPCIYSSVNSFSDFRSIEPLLRPPIS